ncbi:MAG: glutathione transferase [Janthinobacterium lividum]
MESPDLLLYTDAQFISPYAMSAFVALHEKGLPFRVETVDLGQRANRRPDFAGALLTQRVPVLVHDGFALSESSAITEYLDDVLDGPRLYPADPRQRALARQVQAWIRSDFMPIRTERPTEVVFYRPSETPLSDAARDAAAKLLAATDALLAPGASNLFDEWCIADLDLALMLNRLALNGDAVPDRLAEYARHQWRRPSVQRWIELERP